MVSIHPYQTVKMIKAYKSFVEFASVLDFIVILIKIITEIV